MVITLGLSLPIGFRVRNIGRHRPFATCKRFRQWPTCLLRPGAAVEMLDARKASLIATRDAVTEPVFRADLDRRIKQCDEYRKSRVEAAQHWARIAGLPAPEWKIADLGGKEHSLLQCRGQVVVLDFWFRQCSFCIRVMPQVERAAATFRQEKAPVSFFGVSIDKEEADAKFVADTMKLRYPVLRSEKLAEQLARRNEIPNAAGDRARRHDPRHIRRPQSDVARRVNFVHSRVTEE
jgi:peroxiredoxin